MECPGALTGDAIGLDSTLDLNPSLLTLAEKGKEPAVSFGIIAVSCSLVAISVTRLSVDCVLGIDVICSESPKDAASSIPDASMLLASSSMT